MTSQPERFVHVIQGEYAVSGKEADVLTTVLGSCVAVCLLDPVRKLGGMNHFLLPTASSSDGKTSRFGVHAMEELINELLKRGAERSRLRAKVFGGASMVGNLRDIGAENAAFARRFLKDEGIPCLAESLGGRSARRIRFWPVSGRVRQMTVETLDVRDLMPSPVAPGNDHAETSITLF